MLTVQNRRDTFTRKWRNWYANEKYKSAEMLHPLRCSLNTFKCPEKVHFLSINHHWKQARNHTLTDYKADITDKETIGQDDQNGEIQSQNCCRRQGSGMVRQGTALSALTLVTGLTETIQMSLSFIHILKQSHDFDSIEEYKPKACIGYPNLPELWMCG